MGFYGNITNVARTQFQFDKTYANRRAMDVECYSDGVYPGRYVLIEYGSQEKQMKRLYLNDGIPYANINAHPYYDGDTKEVVYTYIQPPDEELRYKVVTRDYKNQETDLIIYEDEIIAIPEGRQIKTNNSELKYIKFSDFNKADGVEVLSGDYEASQQILKTYLEGKNLITDAEPWESWSEKTHVHIVNGKVIFGSLKILDFQDYPVSLNDIVWKVNPGDDYRTNAYTTYFKPNVTLATKENEVYTANVTFDVVSGTGGDDYSNNHAIDKYYYDTSRGYDSTVWQKVLSGGLEKYVMVAELNSVVPTFSIVNDAPSLIPLAPHFDGNSTNVYYRLHWQPSWAIRTKAAFPHYKVQGISQQGEFSDVGYVSASADTAVYPSDQFTSWKGQFYNTISNNVSEKTFNREKNKWEEETDLDRAKGNYDIPAAIYYNKDGFNPAYISHSTLLTLEDNNPNYDGAIAASNPKWNPEEDKIGFFPTGRSGHMYNTHDNTLEGSPQVDTQEFMIMLPSIGNAISAVWDVVYGGRNTNTTIGSSLQRNMSIEWHDGADLPDRTGLRLRGYDDGYNTAEVNTVAGAINSVHDLMGMIITKSDIDLRDKDHLDTTSLSMDRIYYNTSDKDYYRKQLQYEYTEITSLEQYKAAQDNAYTAIPPETPLKDFNTTILKYVGAEDKQLHYNPVFYQEASNSVKGDDATKYNYIQETAYHPNRLYFALDGLQTYDGTEVNLGKLNVYKPDSYFYTTIGEDALLLDKDEEASISKTYYEIKNVKEWGNREQFFNYEERLPNNLKMIKLPSEYDAEQMENPGSSRNPEIIHGIYQPNKYYYAEMRDNKIVKFILDANPIPSSKVHYTIDKTQPIDPEEGSYSLEITYSLKNETQQNINTKESYKTYTYYYIPAGTANLPTQADILAGNVSADVFKLATSSWEAIKTQAHNFGDDKNPIYVFRKVEEYVQLDEPTYKIIPKPIYLHPWEPQSIFEPIFDEVTGKLVSILFVDQDNIPVTEWDKVIDEEGRETVQLVLKNTNDKIISDLYVLGVHPGAQYASGYSLINLSEIANKTITNHYISKCEGTFYESGLYHYVSVLEKPPLDQSYLLDNSLSGQYIDKKEYITYYKIDEENISLIPNTFNAQPVGTYPTTVNEYKNKNYFYQATDGKYKPVVKTPAPNTVLYTVTPSNDFYEPNKYYTVNPEKTGEYVLSRSEEMPTGTLYKKNGIYVIEDKNGVYPYGTEWNLNATTYPEGVKLATRTENYGVTKIPNLARTDNTIHGLILRINQILEAGNTGIRDVSTVQGALNRLNDIIARIDKMKSGQFVIVDEYGRMHSADFTTAQAFSTTNEQASHAETNSEAASEDRWISLEVNPQYNKPSFTLIHNHTRVDDTETTSDKNGEATIAAADRGNNNNTTDVLKLYTPIVDNMGHIVGKNTETVTLPYSFKHINTKGVDNVNNADIYTTITTVDNGANTSALTGIGNTALQADKTQDSLTINPANKWIQTKISPAGTGKNDTDALVIAHEIHAIDTVSRKTDLNSPAVNTITLQDTVYDAAGHLVENHAHEYTLPFGFKSIGLSQSTATSQLSTNTNTTVADNTQDTLNLAAANKWIRTAGNNSTNTIQIAHEIHSIDTSAATGTDLNNSENSTFTVQDLVFDAAGHVTSNKTHQYTLPYNFKTITIGAATTATEGGSTNTTNVNLVADSHIDTLTINPGNRWIALEGQEGLDTLTIAHAHAGDDTGRLYGDAEAKTPKFGATFQVPYFGVDEAGHIKTKSAHPVTIPKPSLTNGTGNVVTGLSLDAVEGAFTETKANVGTLSIAGFNSDIEAGALQDTDTINTALAKLQSRIAANEETVADLDVDDTAIAGQYVSSVTQADGKITVSRADLPTASTMAFGNGEINNIGQSGLEIKISDEETVMLGSIGLEAQPTLIYVINSMIDRINELEAIIAKLHTV